MREVDEYVFDYVCEDACVEVAMVKSVKKCSPGGRSQAISHENTLRVPIYCAGQVRGRLIMVCGAPRPMA